MKTPGFLLLITIALLLHACNSPSSTSPASLGDTAFQGCAFLDENANGSKDSEDTPLGGLTFTVTLSKGAGFGGTTSDRDGCATILIPASLSKADWPVAAKMRLPAALDYVPAGEDVVSLEYPAMHVDFLFARP